MLIRHTTAMESHADKDKGEIQIETSNAFDIVFEGPELKNKEQFACSTKEDMKKWMNSINSRSGFGYFLQKYNVGKEIGKGKFSIVFSCVFISI